MKNNPAKEFVSLNLKQTTALGVLIANELSPNSILAFFGELGAGKTSIIKSIASVLSGTPSHLITSPTFSYMHIYTGKMEVYHFDLYRLKNSNEFLSMGFDDYFHNNGVCLIEWAERIENILPKETVKIHISHLPKGRLFKWSF